MDLLADSNLQLHIRMVCPSMDRQGRGVPISGSAIPDSKNHITAPFGGEKEMDHLTMLAIMGRVHIPIGKAEVFGS